MTDNIPCEKCNEPMWGCNCTRPEARMTGDMGKVRELLVISRRNIEKAKGKPKEWQNSLHASEADRAINKALAELDRIQASNAAPLTDERIIELADQHKTDKNDKPCRVFCHSDLIAFTRAIIAQSAATGRRER